MAIRKMMMLQGGGLKGTLRLMQENGSVNLSVSILNMKDGNETYHVYVFYDEERSEKIGELKYGALQAAFRSRGPVKAAGIVQSGDGNRLLMTGETEDFDWDKAKSIFYLKSKTMQNVLPAPEYEEPEIEEEPGQNAFSLTEVYPLTDENEQAGIAEEETVPEPKAENEYADAGPQTAEPLFEERNQTEDVNETAPQEEAMIREARHAFEHPRQEYCEQCPVHAKKTIVYPFSKQYREYEWEKTEYPGLKGYWHYITGRLYVDGVLSKIAIGVPGDYAINPPSWLYGFDTYAFADDGEARGYWILFEDA